MTKMIHIMNTAYTFPPAALEAATSIRDYAAATLTMTAFTEHTCITLEDDPVQVSDTRTMPPSTLATSTKHLPSCHTHSGIAPRSQHGVRQRPLRGPPRGGSLNSDPPGPRRNNHPYTRSPRTTSPKISLGTYGLRPSNRRTATTRIDMTTHSAPPPRCNNYNVVIY